MSRVRRSGLAARMAARRPRLTFADDSRKKQGRQAPVGSTTPEVQGAEHRGASAPPPARSCVRAFAYSDITTKGSPDRLATNAWRRGSCSGRGGVPRSSPRTPNPALLVSDASRLISVHPAACVARRIALNSSMFSAHTVTLAWTGWPASALTPSAKAARPRTPRIRS